MVQISLKDVPYYLNSSPLLAAFTENDADDSVIDVPEGCAKFDTEVSTKEGFEQLLLTLSYWQLPETFSSNNSVVAFLFAPNNRILTTAVIKDALLDFKPVFPILQIFQELLLAEDSAKVLLAIQHGQLLCLTYFHEELSLPIPVEACEVAVLRGHLACLKYVHQKRCALTGKLAQIAATHGRLDFLEYLKVHYCTGDISVAHAALENDQLECLQFLWTERLAATCSTHTYTAALHNDSLRCVQFLRSHEVVWGADIIGQAVRANAINCLKYFRSHGGGGAWNPLPLAFEALDAKAVDCLVYLLAEIDLYLPSSMAEMVTYFAQPRTEMHKLALAAVKTMQMVAAKGTVQQFELLREKGYRMGGTDTTAAAASAGNLDCLVYLHQQGCAWNVNTLLTAVQHKHIDCVMFALRAGCPRVSRNIGSSVDILCTAAVNVGDVTILRLLRTHGCPWLTDIRRAIMVALQTNDIPMLEFLFECDNIDNNGNDSPRIAVFDHRVPEAEAERGNLSLLKILHRFGQTTCFTSDAFRIAVMNGHLACVTYLLSQGHILTEAVLCAAAANNRLLCLQYLHAQGGILSGAVYNAAVQSAALACVHYIHSCCLALTDIDQEEPLNRRYVHPDNTPWCAHEMVLHALSLRSAFDLVAILSTIDQPLSRKRIVDDRTFAEQSDAQRELILSATDIVQVVANTGTAEGLQTLHEKGFVWGKGTTTTTTAAASGNLGTLAYLHQQHCAWDESTFLAALEGDHLSCLQYLCSYRCPRDSPQISEFKRTHRRAKGVVFLRQIQF